MRNSFLLAVALLLAMPHTALAQGVPLQMLPPTELGQGQAACPAGSMQLMVYSGSQGAGAGGDAINCSPNISDQNGNLQVMGNLQVKGFIQSGFTATACIPALAGTLRFNTASKVEEYCNGAAWQSLGGIPANKTAVSPSNSIVYECDGYTDANGNMWLRLYAGGPDNGIWYQTHALLAYSAGSSQVCTGDAFGISNSSGHGGVFTPWQ